MNPKRVILTVVLAVALVLGTTGAWWLVQRGDSTGDPRTAARTAFPDLEPAAPVPTLASLATLHPRPGSVVEAAGPFDDRFHFSRLAFDGRTVSGTAEVTSDVSEILEFEALVGFYDRNGRLLGSARHVHHLDESEADPAHDHGVPEEEQTFRVSVPRELRGTAVSAAVGVPVLVNE